MYFYEFDEFKNDTKILLEQIKKSFKPDVLLSVARGGLTLGHFLAMSLNNRNLFVLNSILYDDTKKLDEVKIFNIPNLSGFKKILIIDDMVDSGESMNKIKTLLMTKYPQIHFKIATIFYKNNSIIKPDFYVKEAKEWIEFFWEKFGKDSAIS